MLVRSPLLTSHKWRELVSSGGLICRCYVVFLRCYVCFVILSLKPRPFVQSFFDMRAPRQPHVFLLVFPFCFFVYVAFSEHLCTIAVFLFVWRVRRTYFPSGWCFSNHGLDFFTSAYVRIQSINQSNPSLRPPLTTCWPNVFFSLYTIASSQMVISSH